jgi:hypothetical protein
MHDERRRDRKRNEATIKLLSRLERLRDESTARTVDLFAEFVVVRLKQHYKPDYVVGFKDRKGYGKIGGHSVAFSDAETRELIELCTQGCQVSWATARIGLARDPARRLAMPAQQDHPVLATCSALLAAVRHDPRLDLQTLKSYETLIQRFAPTNEPKRLPLTETRQKLQAFFKRVFSRVPVVRGHAKSDVRKLALLEAARVERFVLRGIDAYDPDSSRAGIGNRESTQRARHRAKRRR